MAARVVVSDEAEVKFLQTFLSAFAVNRVSFHLFKNNLVVDDTATLGSFTECDYSGYAQQDISQIAAASGDSYAEVPGDKGVSGPYVPTFPGNSGADQVAYGMYVTYPDESNTECLLCASNCFDIQGQTSLGGRNISGPSDSVTILVNFRLWDYTQDQGEVVALRIQPPPGNTIGAGVGWDYQIQALFRDRTINTFYAGSVILWTTDPAASHDSWGTLTDGEGSFNGVLNTTGTQIIGIVDINTSHLVDSIAVTVT